MKRERAVLLGCTWDRAAFVKGSFTDGPSANFSTNDQQLSTEQGRALQPCPCWTLQPVFRHPRGGSVGMGTSNFSPRAGWL